MPRAAASLAAPDPTRDAADPGEIGHHEVTGARLQCGLHRLDAVEVLADLQRHLARRRNSGIAGQIVVADRLLEPGGSLRRECRSAQHGVLDRQRLIVIDHHLDARTQPLAHRLQSRQVLVQRRITESQFDRFEAALGQPHSLVRNRVRRHQAQAAGIVGRHRARRAAEHGCKRTPCGHRKRIPHRGVEPGERHPHRSRHADQRKPARQFGRDVGRTHVLAL